MISWLLLTVHTVPEISLEFLWGSYGSQQRPLISITTYFHVFTMFRISQSENTYNMVQIIKSQKKKKKNKAHEKVIEWEK